MKKRYFASLILLLVCICSIFVSACTLLDSREITIKVGTTYNWYQGEEFIYSSSNSDIAKIDEFGLITAISYGECKVYAKSLTENKTLIVKVLKNVLPSYPSSSQKSSYSSFITKNSSYTDETNSYINSNSSLFTSSSNFSYSDIISTEISNCISSPTISSSLSSSSSVLQVYFTLDAKGGEIKDTNWLKSGDKYITYLDTSLPIPEKTGYIFVSWQNESGIVENLIQGGNAYAVWQEISYPIQYVLGEGENDINMSANYYSRFQTRYKKLKEMFDNSVKYIVP